jgi:hypothetical protein
MARADVLGDCLLERGNHRPLRQEVRAQHGLDGVDVLLGDVLATVGNHGS